jgi:hypothetical protein
MEKGVTAPARVLRVEGGAISPKDNLMDFLIKRFWLADHLTDERVGDKQLSSTGQALRSPSPCLDRLVRLYAAFLYWTGSTQLLSVPRRASRVIGCSPVLNRLYTAPLRAWSLDRLVICRYPIRDRFCDAIHVWTN